jgi:hypothetical protein
MPKIIKADVRFGKNVPAIVIYVTPWIGRVIWIHLRMPKYIPVASLDVLSEIDSEKKSCFRKT